MEFDEHEDQEAEEEEEEEEEKEQEEEEMGIPVPPPSYDSLSNSATRASKMGHTPAEGGGVSSTIAARKGSGSVRYRECLKNHAVSIGGHAVDGCGEFMAAGEEGTLDALKCAACNCHRNFHRKETEGEISLFQQQQHYHHHHQYQQLTPYYRTPPPATGGYLQHHYQPHHPLGTHSLPQHLPLALPAAAASGGGLSREEEDMSNPSSSGGGGGGNGTKKRFRTKFTLEQKEKMLAFAGRLGWRIQKHDDLAVEQLCAEIGVKRHVLKVWMHNNKHSLGKKP